MSKLIRRFKDGSTLEYDRGSFDDWCVYLERPGKAKKPPRDVDYFNQIKEYGKKYGNDQIYSDYCRVYEATGKELSKDVFDQIESISSKYDKEDELEISIVFSVLYMAMVAEEKKEHTRLGKRIKRLGIHGILMENATVEHAANFMKGMKWREIDKLCSDRGF